MNMIIDGTGEADTFSARPAVRVKDFVKTNKVGCA